VNGTEERRNRHVGIESVNHLKRKCAGIETNEQNGTDMEKKTTKGTNRKRKEIETEIKKRRNGVRNENKPNTHRNRNGTRNGTEYERKRNTTESERDVTEWKRDGR
jgi:hypothetical protein